MPAKRSRRHAQKIDVDNHSQVEIWEIRLFNSIFCAKICGGSVKNAIPFACAVEMVHNFSLIHDDLPSMDDDDVRRGKPSCHKKFGEALAILAGDALLNLAFEIIADSKQKKALDAVKLISDAVGVTNMLGGQALDIEYERKQKSDSLLKRNINAMKTAALMASSCKLGALAASATKKENDILYQFGLDLGHAFQVADDVADMKCGKVMLNRMKKDVRMFVSKAKLKIAHLRKKSGILEYITDEILRKAEKE